MADFYTEWLEWRRRENICPLTLPNKEQYYRDLLNIEHSWTGRIGIDVTNAFIMEAEQQLINAIELFEQGYFDCAYYSLRSAVDISTTIVFLADMPDEEREKYLEAWKSTADFPMQGQMIKQLSKKGNVFADMQKKMPDFFSAAKTLSAELNKYVHKQGLQHFYVSRNHTFSQNKSQDIFIVAFEGYLVRCIGVVAVMRLAIDPFPILLMDEEILYRCFDSITDPYSREFVEKYIGLDLVEQYKQTAIYSGFYDYLMNEEKKNDATFDVMKYQCIDTSRLDDIYSQFHLLALDDRISVLLVAASEKIVKTYCVNGILMYFTDRETNRKKLSWSRADFDMFTKAEYPFNQPYDEAYMSVFQFGGNKYFAEHNIPLSSDEIGKIVGFVSGALAKMDDGALEQK